ncbi:MAG: acetylxylan esterase [Planctomycetota bacterium]
MPLIDLPLDELHAYTGRTPKPDDHDAYWRRGLAELDALDPQAELVPVDTGIPNVDCFDLWFTGVGGARVHAKYVRPSAWRGGDRPGPALLRFHGYTMDAGEWGAQLPYVSAGFRVAALDCRGQGGRSTDPFDAAGTTLHGHIVRGLEDDDPDKLYYRNVFLDTALLARIVAGFDEVDADRLASCGGSQGGALSLVCASLETRIAKCATTFPFLCDYRRVWEMDLAKQAYDGLGQFFRRHDPQHRRIDHWFGKLGYIDVQHLTPRIAASVCMAIGLMDSVCPPSTQFAAYNKITSPKRLEVFPDFGHEHLPGWLDAELRWLCDGWF